MDIGRFAVDRPVTVCMIILLLVMLGGLCLVTAEVELLPDISVPTLVVVTEWPNSSPQEVFEKVTEPLEDVLNRTGGLKNITSVSVEGESQVQLEFNWGKNIDFAMTEVREKLNSVDLPDDSRKPRIWRWDPSAQPVFRFDIYDSTGRLTLTELKQIAEDRIKDRLQRLDGVGTVSVFGGTESEYQVLLDQEKLQAHGLAFGHVIRALQTESVDRRGGRVEIGPHNYTIRVLGRARSAADLEAIVVDPMTQTRIRDVASVRVKRKDAETYARIDRQPTVGITVRKASGASTVTAIDRVKMELERLRQGGLPEGIGIEVSQDDSEYIEAAQGIVIGAILQGSILAGILLVLALRNLRSAVIVGVSAPLSLISAFLFLRAFGVSRNVLSLGGLGIAAGMVLDSSIVILESIYKQLEYGKEPREAAIQGAGEVRLGVIASNLTTVAAFLPILLMSGIIREIFRDLALAIIGAMALSMVVGALFIPMIASRILRSKREQRQEGGGVLAALVRPGIRALEGLDSLSEGLVGRILGSCLRRPLLGIGVVLVLLVVCVGSVRLIPGSAFLPAGKVEEIWVTVEPPIDYGIAALDEKVRQIEDVLLAEDVPYVRMVASEVRSNEAKIFVRMKSDAKDLPPGERRVMGVSEVLQDVRLRLADITDVAVYANLADKAGLGSGAPIQFKVSARNPDTHPLKDVQGYVKDVLVPRLRDQDAVPGAFYVRTERTEPQSEYAVIPDVAKASAKGVSATAVSDTIRAMVYGIVPITIEGERDDVDVKVIGARRPGADDKFSAEDLATLKVASAAGGYEEIRNIARIKPTKSNWKIERSNRRDTVTLSCDLRPYRLSGRTLGQVTADAERVVKASPGFGKFAYQIQSTAKDNKEAFAMATKAIIISAVLIYVIMCAQFESMAHPLAIMFTLPLAAIGVVALLRHTHETLSLSALVGLIALGGIVVNNGIILIEFVNILRRRGQDRDSAIIAGSQRKLRSVMITTITTLLGMMPILVGVGAGKELYKGSAAVLFGGLLTSAPLTLIVLPVVYAQFDRVGDIASMVAMRMRSIFMRGRIAEDLVDGPGG